MFTPLNTEDQTPCCSASSPRRQAQQTTDDLAQLLDQELVACYGTSSSNFLLCSGRAITNERHQRHVSHAKHNDILGAWSDGSR